MFLTLNLSSVFNFQIISPKTHNQYTFPKNPHAYIQVKPYFEWFFASQEGISPSFSLCSFSDMLSRVVWWKIKYKRVFCMFVWNLIRVRRVRPNLSYRISEYYPTFIPVSVCARWTAWRRKIISSAKVLSIPWEMSCSLLGETIRLLWILEHHQGVLTWYRSSHQSHLLISKTSKKNL